MYRRSIFDDLFEQFRDMDNLFRRAFYAGFPRLNDSGRLLPSGSTAGSELAPRSSGTLPSLWGEGFYPAMESFQKDGRIFIRAELPGVEPESVDVSLTGDQLTIKGEKKLSRDVQESDFLFRELSHGRFERTFTLPKGVKSEDIKATFQNGLMEVSMPVPADAEPKKVKVKVK